MKKIMFNDKYGLTQAVLEGRKTMTRRFVPDGTPLGSWKETAKRAHYQIGEEIAVAQSYSNLRDVLAKRDFKRTDALYDRFYRAMQMGETHDGIPGWGNKMFVRADLMPHRIRITDIKAERLQDISEEDCLREGIVKTACVAPYGFPIGNGKWKNYRTPQDAFSTLIDKVSCRGTWERNPWVFVYEFELLR